MLIVMVMIVFAIKSQQQQQVNEDYGICGLSGLICVLVFRSPLKADDWIDMILILLHDDRVQYCYNYCRFGCGLIDSIYVLPTMIKDKLVLLSWKVNAVQLYFVTKSKVLMLLSMILMLFVGTRKFVLLVRLVLHNEIGAVESSFSC
ncbi:hypothetical protein Tco_0855246 [Tanacetum coccineum]